MGLLDFCAYVKYNVQYDPPPQISTQLSWGRMFWIYYVLHSMLLVQQGKAKRFMPISSSFYFPGLFGLDAKRPELCKKWK